MDPQKGYNKRGGGSHGAMSKEACQKVSKALKGRKLSDETRQKISAYWEDFVMSEEEKHKRSVSQLGKQLTEDHKLAIKKGRTGSRPMTDGIITKMVKPKDYDYYLNLGFKFGVCEETKKHMSEAKKGKKQKRHAASSWIKGKHQSEETKRKISETLKLRKAAEKQRKEGNICI